MYYEYTFCVYIIFVSFQQVLSWNAGFNFSWGHLYGLMSLLLEMHKPFLCILHSLYIQCLIHWWVTGMCRTLLWRLNAVCQVFDFLQQLWCLHPSLLPPWVHTAWVPWTWGPYLAASTPPAHVGQWWGGGWKRRTSKAPVGGNSICSKVCNEWMGGGGGRCRKTKLHSTLINIHIF